MNRVILIIGILGQDGQYLSSLFNGDSVFGICRPNTNIDRMSKNMFTTDFTDYKEVKVILNHIKPDVIINFAGVTNVFNPWDELTMTHTQLIDIPMNILRYMVEENRNIFLFQASSSLMYGKSIISEITETTPLNPLYPYGIDKAYIHNIIGDYRSKFGLKCCSGIFFNHDSPLRGSGFLSKKVAKFIASVIKGNDEILKLGSLDSYKDISHAKDFMSGVKLIIDHDLSEDFVFSSGSAIKTHDFVKLFFDLHNLDFKKYVVLSDNGRNENMMLFGNNNKLKSVGWKPEYGVNELILEMVKNELNNA